MSATPPHRPRPHDPPIDEAGVFLAMVQVVRARILSGLIAALPIALTVFIVHWLYVTAQTALTWPIRFVRYELGNYGLSATVWDAYVAPVIAVALILFFLYTLGLFVRSRLLRAVDWVLLRVPIVGTIFKAIRNVFESLGHQLQGNAGFKRVVLVEFPNPGMRSLAFVTNTLRDATTDKTILCVTVLTGVMPPSGFTLFVPEEKVTDIAWSMNETLQAILSGGITSPGSIHYYEGIRVPPTGPIIDPTGHPIRPTHEGTATVTGPPG